METYFDQLLEEIQHNLNENLPGEWAQNLMMPEGRINSAAPNIKPVPSAVLIVFFEDNKEIFFPIIRRPVYEGLHSGQMGFPGGKFENSDTTLIYTALRETEEEIGVNINDIVVLGTLSTLYIPVTNMHVTPVVGYLKSKPNYILDAHEVDTLFNVNIRDILTKSKKANEVWNIRGLEVDVPFYHIQEQKIWGATAMILSELEQMLTKCNLPSSFTE